MLSLFMLCLGIASGVAQTDTVYHRRVLATDSSEIYGRKFPALAFSDSYFTCAHQYGTAFSDQEFNSFLSKIQNFNSAITAYKANDNKRLVCIFRKTALRGIFSLSGFINSNLTSNFSSNLLNVKTTQIEVVRAFDPLDKEDEKGFNQLTN